jgi:hypothetical protein
VLSLASMVDIAMGGLSFGLFIKPMGDDLGLGRAVVGWAQTARQVTGALSGPMLATWPHPIYRGGNDGNR